MAKSDLLLQKQVFAVRLVLFFVVQPVEFDFEHSLMML